VWEACGCECVERAWLHQLPHQLPGPQATQPHHRQPSPTRGFQGIDLLVQVGQQGAHARDNVLSLDLVVEWEHHVLLDAHCSSRQQDARTQRAAHWVGRAAAAYSERGPAFRWPSCWHGSSAKREASGAAAGVPPRTRCAPPGGMHAALCAVVVLHQALPAAPAQPPPTNTRSPRAGGWRPPWPAPPLRPRALPP
jgi:hypothetical protein